MGGVTPVGSLLWLVCPSGSITDGCCDLDWDPFGKSCYFFSKVALSWDEARDWCNGHESHLLILSTDKEWVRKGGLLSRALLAPATASFCLCFRTLWSNIRVAPSTGWA